MINLFAPSIDHPRTLVMVVADDSTGWQLVQEQLRASSWQVELVDLAALADANGVEDVLPPMEGVRAAVVMLGPELRSEPGIEGRRLDRMVVYLQGSLGASRVVGLVEDSQMAQVADLGMTTVPFPSSGPGPVELTALLSHLSAAVAATEGVPESPLARGVRSIRPDIWLLIGPLAVLCAFLMVFGLGWLNWRPAGDDQVVIEVDMALLQPVLPSSLAPRPGSTDGEPGDAPFGQLPVTCIVDVSSHGEPLPAVISCQGAGQVTVEGFSGPWHNEISVVEAESAVVGTVMLEARSGQPPPPPVPLRAGGELSLEPFEPTFGVDRLELVFGADHQRVTLRQAVSRGGASATLTFVLGS